MLLQTSGVGPVSVLLYPSGAAVAGLGGCPGLVASGAGGGGAGSSGWAAGKGPLLFLAAKPMDLLVVPSVRSWCACSQPVVAAPWWSRVVEMTASITAARNGEG